MHALAKISATLVMATALSLGFATTRASKACAEWQDDMNQAIEHLRQAKNDLEHAAANKGGHRENAMHMIDQAIGEVQAGKAYANSHPDEHHDHDHDHDHN
jgi:hypothetical protein